MNDENINLDFDIPYYIFDEITEYLEYTAKGNKDCIKWNNIIMLLNMSVMCNRLSKEQAKFIKRTYCREK